jgi:PAS domain S-box-containing protein
MRLSSLKARAAVALGVVVLLVATAHAVYVLLATHRALRQRLEANALQFARLATRPLCAEYEQYRSGGLFKLRQSVRDLLAQAPDVTAVEIVDVDGRVVLDSRHLADLRFGDETGSPPAPSMEGERLRAIRGLEPTLLPRRDESGAEALEIVVPFVEDWGRHRLSVSYHLSYGSLGAAFRRQLLVTAGFTMLSMFLGAGVGLLLARRVTQPLSDLAAGVGDIAEGRFERRLGVPAESELRVVAGAFNDMAARLQQTVGDVRRSLARWRSLVENAPVVVLSATPEGIVEFANAEPKGPEGFVGRSLQDIAGPNVSPEVRQQLARTVRMGDPANFEVEGPSLDGGRAWYSVHVGAVREEDRVVGLTLVGVDVTEMRQARLERERLFAELEARNAELERFTYTVSHDLRSPLVTVRGFLGLLERDLARADAARVADDVARIRSATDRMDLLLKSLLDLSRVGRLANSPEAVPLATLVREAAELLAESISARGVRLEIDSDLPSLFGDRVRLLELVLNLLDNAVKFLGQQEDPRVAVGCRRDAEGPIVYVRDNGIGIEARHHERIFGLFDRLDPSVEGTGIGLSIVRRIVEVHGGHIWVESEGRGKGATFCFRLPAPPGAPTP